MNPDWSPDGRRLVFALKSSGRDSLWTATADASDPQNFLECRAPCVSLDDPAWSPDGQRVAYARNAKDSSYRGTLELVDLQGKVEVLLDAGATGGFAGARWSPDGTKLVVEQAQSTDGLSTVTGVTLSVVDLGTRPVKVTPLTDPALLAGTADWSPDGRTIVYAALPAAGAPGHELFTIHPDGTGIRQVTHLSQTGGVAMHPAYTRDGKHLLFAALLPAEGRELVLAEVDLDGQGLRPAIGKAYIVGTHPRPSPA